jgi:hypothetical protein
MCNVLNQLTLKDEKSKVDSLEVLAAIFQSELKDETF